MVTGKSNEPERSGTSVRGDASPCLELQISVSAAGKPNKIKTLSLYIHPHVIRVSEPSLSPLLLSNSLKVLVHEAACSSLFSSTLLLPVQLVKERANPLTGAKTQPQTEAGAGTRVPRYPGLWAQMPDVHPSQVNPTATVPGRFHSACLVHRESL